MEDPLAKQRIPILLASAIIIMVLVVITNYFSGNQGITGNAAFTAGATPINPSSIGFGGSSRSNNYEELVNSLYRANTTTTVTNLLWVPWFSTSTGCAITDLKSGSSCNSGETIDFTHNCMVTDEFSQVGIIVAMGQNQTRMDQFFGTVNAISSSNGRIPAWRVYRSGNTIEQCRSGINGNCDTASDATARIIIALYTASNNTAFSLSQRALYRELATNLSSAFVQYEVLNSCTQSNLGYGQICHWMAAGSGAKSGGFGATDFAYTGYFGDGIIAMLQACSQTRNNTYCAVAGNFTLNYLQAANFDGATFRVPPGRSFKWTNTGGVPIASCTNTCNPDQWDYADASRAVGICMANYYASLINVTLPGLQSYCTIWGNKYMNSTTSAPIQYSSDGTNSAYQSGFFAQGLEAMFQMGGHNQGLFEATLDSSLSHYNTGSRTWDNTACFGVYTAAFAVRALGAGIGRDMPSFSAIALNSDAAGGAASQNNAAQQSGQNISFLTTTPVTVLTINTTTNQTFRITLNTTTAQYTTITWLLNNTNQTTAYNKTNYTFNANNTTAGTWNITVNVQSDINNITHQWTITVVSIDMSNNSNTNNSNNASQNNASQNNASQNDSPQNNTPRNISFLTTTPVTPLTINTTTNQTFRITLNTTTAQYTTITWLLNNTNQTTAYNKTNYTFNANNTTAGTWNITVNVQSDINNITHQWTLTVNRTAAENSSSNMTNTVNDTSSANNIQDIAYNTPAPDATPSQAQSGSGGGGSGGGAGAEIPPPIDTNTPSAKSTKGSASAQAATNESRNNTLNAPEQQTVAARDNGAGNMQTQQSGTQSPLALQSPELVSGGTNSRIWTVVLIIIFISSILTYAFSKREAIKQRVDKLQLTNKKSSSRAVIIIGTFSRGSTGSPFLEIERREGGTAEQIERRPAIEHSISKCKTAGATDITISAWRSDTDIHEIKARLGNGERYGVHLTYTMDESMDDPNDQHDDRNPSGDANILQRISRLGNMNATTIICDIPQSPEELEVDMSDMLSQHTASGALATIFAAPSKEHRSALVFDGARITGFTDPDHERTQWTNGGTVIIDPSVTRIIPSERCMIEADLLKHIASNSRIYAYVAQKYRKKNDEGTAQANAHAES